jgi:hypothetical protein
MWLHSGTVSVMFGPAAVLGQARSVLADANLYPHDALKGTFLPGHNPMTTAATRPDSPDKRLHLSSETVGPIQMPPNSGKYGHLHTG